MTRLFTLAAAAALAAGACSSAPSPERPEPSEPDPVAGAEHVRTVEGIEEYRLENGLQVLLFPDATRSSVTVNTTYFVGSRHEGYGETGMAHLLEHLLFYGTERHPDITAAISARGGRGNGTTSSDRTNYFQTLPATQDNLSWAISMEADRMVNAAFTSEDLASEMTVVRNEFEAQKNSPIRVLLQRVLSVAYDWHGYGRHTLGARSDIESVPMDRLRSFYRRYYQPDNAMVVVTGDFDREWALASIEREFGAIAAPDRDGELRLYETYTREPAQEGERSVTVRRAGDTRYVMASYHVPAGGHELFPAVSLLAHVIGSEPSGRLYRALVEPGLASSAGAFVRDLREPGVLVAHAAVSEDQDVEEVREVMLETLSEAAKEPIDASEVARARASRLNQFASRLDDSTGLGIALSEWASRGDWRLFFYHRDRIEEIEAAQVEKVASRFLRPSNRTVGTFIPDDAADRVGVPSASDLGERLSHHEFAEAARGEGDRFDSTPENVHEHLIVEELSSGMRLAMLPKPARGERVTGLLVIRLGDEERLRGERTAAQTLPRLLLRGTEHRSRQEIRDRVNELQSGLHLYGSENRGVAALETRRDSLESLIPLVAEVLREPALEESELDVIVRRQVEALREARTQPGALAGAELAVAMSGMEGDHPLRPLPIDEGLERTRELEIEDLRALHDRMYGGGDATLVLVGDFDPGAVSALVREHFEGWEAEVPYERIPADDHAPEGEIIELTTPDRENATLIGALRVPVGDEHEDYPALELATRILGGGTLSSRLSDRIRDDEGLSYSVGAQLAVESLDDVGTLYVHATFAPQNRDRVLALVREEVARAVRDGFTEEELEAARQGWLSSRQVSRGEDDELARTISRNLASGRDMLFEDALEERIRAVEVRDLDRVFERYVDPEALTVVVAGDFE